MSLRSSQLPGKGKLDGTGFKPGFGVWGLGVWGLGFRVWGLGFEA